MRSQTQDLEQLQCEILLEDLDPPPLILRRPVRPPLADLLTLAIRAEQYDTVVDLVADNTYNSERLTWFVRSTLASLELDLLLGDLGGDRERPPFAEKLRILSFLICCGAEIDSENERVLMLQLPRLIESDQPVVPQLRAMVIKKIP